jgi:hypothetical protein
MKTDYLHCQKITLFLKHFRAFLSINGENNRKRRMRRRQDRAHNKSARAPVTEFVGQTDVCASECR